MKKLQLLMLAMLGTLFVHAGTTISNVKVQQRYPWNGLVDIWFDLESTRNNIGIEIEALNTENGQTVHVEALEEDGCSMDYPYVLSSGHKHIVWNAEKDAPGLVTKSLAVSIHAGPITTRSKYMIYDLTKKDLWSALVTRDSVPEGGWTEEYKSTKLVLKLIQPGSFIQGPDGNFGNARAGSRKAMITLPYYISIFPITESQWNIIMGENEEAVPRAKLGLLVNDIRGSNAGHKWPEDDSVDADSFLGRLRAKFGQMYDLPTDAQWEYAIEANSTSFDNITPNAWGIYIDNENGRVYGEWCLDWYQYLHIGPSEVVDPKGVSEQDSAFVAGGVGTRVYHKYGACGASRMGVYDDNRSYGSMLGFRIVLPMPTK